MILQNDLKRQFQLHAAEYEAKALEVLRSGWYIRGREVEQFEREWAAYIGTRCCVGVGNGLDALTIGIKMLGIGAGDEVIVCANAYIACVIAITANGATPVFVEPDVYDNLDAEAVEAAITPRTKAILAVHLFGQACDMTRIMELAQRYDLRVVEDCAQSHGNHWRDQRVGSIGDIGCFSFYPTKGCGAFGDGGAITTNDPELAQRCRVFSNYGSEKRYHNAMVGCNSRLDELQAGLLRVKLTHLDELNEERCNIARQYLERIQNPHVRLPRIRPGADSSWHQFVIHADKRDALMAHLTDLEIGTLIHYPIPPHLQEAYRYLGLGVGSYPIAEQAATEVLSLPMFNGMTQAEIDAVIDAVNAFHPD